MRKTFRYMQARKRAARGLHSQPRALERSDVAWWPLGVLGLLYLLGATGGIFQAFLWLGVFLLGLAIWGWRSGLIKRFPFGSLIFLASTAIFSSAVIISEFEQMRQNEADANARFLHVMAKEREREVAPAKATAERLASAEAEEKRRSEERAAIEGAIARTRLEDEAKTKLKEETRSCYYEMARNYYRGLDVPRDEEKGIQYYKKAARLGHTEAIIFLNAIGEEYASEHVEREKPLRQQGSVPDPLPR